MKLLPTIVCLCLVASAMTVPVSVNQQDQMNEQIANPSTEKSSLFDQLIGVLSNIVAWVVKSEPVQNALNAKSEQPSGTQADFPTSEV
uniref:Uncharacterized protein n=1 Tax=Plectus sambesii TaxID=2011161 RepID=A0A914UWH3_9BILA